MLFTSTVLELEEKSWADLAVVVRGGAARGPRGVRLARRAVSADGLRDRVAASGEPERRA